MRHPQSISVCRSTTRRILSALCLLSLLVFGIASVAAQGKIYRLEPRKVSDIPTGKAVMINGEAGPQPHRFFLDQLTINTPVMVTLRPVRRGDDIRLKISKLAWGDVRREGSTKDGQVSFKFRTEGEFQISVDASNTGKPYKLLVWVGDEVKPELRPVVVPKSEYREEGASWFSGGGIALWLIAAALLGIFVLLLFIVLRRKS